MQGFRSDMYHFRRCYRGFGRGHVRNFGSCVPPWIDEAFHKERNRWWRGGALSGLEDVALRRCGCLFCC